MDGVLIANEVIRSLKNSRTGGYLIKIYFEKAYDYVDWNFWSNMLKKLGYGAKWCSWISECISTPSMPVLINRSTSSEFRMLRGIRQGVPVCPFLFNVVVEALNHV